MNNYRQLCVCNHTQYNYTHCTLCMELLLVLYCSPVDYLSGQPSRLLLAAALTGLTCHSLQIIVIRLIDVQLSGGRVVVSNTLNGEWAVRGLANTSM